MAGLHFLTIFIVILFRYHYWKSWLAGPEYIRFTQLTSRMKRFPVASFSCYLQHIGTHNFFMQFNRANGIIKHGRWDFVVIDVITLSLQIYFFYQTWVSVQAAPAIETITLKIIDPMEPNWLWLGIREFTLKPLYLIKTKKKSWREHYLVREMAWHQTGGKLLPEQRIVKLFNTLS